MGSPPLLSLVLLDSPLLTDDGQWTMSRINEEKKKKKYKIILQNLQNDKSVRNIENYKNIK